MATFYFVKGDAVKLLKHHLEILLQFVPGLAIFFLSLIDWTIAMIASNLRSPLYLIVCAYGYG